MATKEVTVITGAAPYAVEISDGVHRWLGDEPAALGGGDAGPAPFSLLLSSLGACTAITLQMYAARKKWPLSKVEVRLSLNANGKPADGATEIGRELRLHGDLSEEQRQRLLEIANACPTHKVLTGTIRIGTNLEP